MKKALVLIISIISILLASCSSLHSVSEEAGETLRIPSSVAADSGQDIKESEEAISEDLTQGIPTSSAEQKKKYKSFDSYGYDVDGEDLKFLAETLYAANESYGAFRLFDIIGIDTKAIDNTLHLNEYRKQWTKIKSGLEVFFDYSANTDMYFFFLENQSPGIYSTIPLGSRGPAGGFVFYDCDADNDSGNADGLISFQCGWRFLEAAPLDLSRNYPFGWYMIDGKAVYVDGDTAYHPSSCTGTAIGTGKKNTELLVTAIGSAIYSGTTYAAKMCDTYEYINPVNFRVYDDWFLPSLDELYQLIILNKSVDCNMTARDYWWSSSEQDKSPKRAWGVSLHGAKDTSWNGNTRGEELRVRPIRAF